MKQALTFDRIRNSKEIRWYLECTDKVFTVSRYTEHGIKHALHASKVAGYILESLGYTQEEQEFAKIAAYVHDIGNMISMYNHDQRSAVMFLNVIDKDIYNEDVLAIVSAVGCHEDRIMEPISPVAAALIIGDKTDVRHERIRYNDSFYHDKHSRVIAACKDVNVVVDKEKNSLEFRVLINTRICSVMDYFEICSSRTNYCKRATNVLKCDFILYINEDKFL
jgi:metal-dependent HD superfamily phosphatase/phosphodiesterase